MPEDQNSSTDQKETLYSLIQRIFPEFTDSSGALHFGLIGKALGRTRQTMHSCIWQNNSISAANARALILQSNGQLTADMILPYIS